MKWKLLSGLALIVIVTLISLRYIRKEGDFSGDSSDTETQGNDSTTPGNALTQTKTSSLLPDLAVTPTRHLYIESDSGTRNIRFSTTFINKGKGPFEVIRESTSDESKIIAKQIIFNRDGSTEEMLIGEFVYHPTHEHWHIDNYVQFELWTHDEEGLRQDLVTSTSKMSFCIWDEEGYDTSIENAPKERIYEGCNNLIQGISVGWADTYSADIEGQILSIDGLEDGNYLTRTVINPDRKILEEDYANNESIMYVEISGGSIRIRDLP